LRRCDSCRRAGHGGTASRCGQDSAVEDSTRASAPQLEDFLENHPREAELTVTDFRQNTPGDGTPATESTTAYLSYDDKNFYAVFVCHDEAGEVRAHLSKREASDQDDGVGILLDTFRDFHRAYFFYSNPLGVQTDAIYTEGQGYDWFDVQRSLGGSDAVNGPFAPTKQFTSDVLLTYLLLPGTAVYLGYNNGFTDLTLNPSASPPVKPLGPPNNSTSRLFFIKLSYLLRF